MSDDGENKVLKGKKKKKQKKTLCMSDDGENKVLKGKKKKKLFLSDDDDPLCHIVEYRDHTMYFHEAV